MSQVDLLRHVVSILEEAGIEYMITGSISSSLQGEPRATHDLDVAVEIRDADVPVVLAAFPQPRFYVDREAIREAMRTPANNEVAASARVARSREHGAGAPRRQLHERYEAHAIRVFTHLLSQAVRTELLAHPDG